jgi:four helix bundle protein
LIVQGFSSKAFGGWFMEAARGIDPVGDVSMTQGRRRQSRLFLMQDYEKLEVWKHAHRVALNVQRVTARIARRDNSGLVSQLRRAATSVPANIAEGSCKESNREFARFLQIAAGSAAELHYHIRFATDSSVIPGLVGETLLAETTRVRKMLFALLKRVRETDPDARHKPSTNSVRREASRLEPFTDAD